MKNKTRLWLIRLLLRGIKTHHLHRNQGRGKYKITETPRHLFGNEISQKDPPVSEEKKNE